MRHLGAFVHHAWPTIVWNVALAWVAGPLAYAAWAVAWFTTYGLFLRLRSLAEHACMERTDDITKNTRTTIAGLVARMTVAPLHVNYHLEHHLLPTVPWYRLPAMSRLLAGRVPEPTRGYGAVLTSVSRSASR